MRDVHDDRQHKEFKLKCETRIQFRIYNHI